MYQDAQYCKPYGSDEVTCIKVTISGVLSFVPLDPANSDYAAIMQLVAANELTIAEAS